MSPQRLLRHRDNWYLDAWCHKRQAMRTFNLEQILHRTILGEAAEEIADDGESVLDTNRTLSHLHRARLSPSRHCPPASDRIPSPP